MTPVATLHRLRSGLRVAVVEAPHLHSVMCAVSVRVGSRHETPRTNGVSHLLEHLFFRGSRRYPDSVAMNAAVEGVGGNLNAVTMRDFSTFYTPVHPDGVPLALDILGDMLTRPRLVELDIERRVILEEILDEVDQRGRDIDVDNLAKRQLYGGHPLALKIAGSPRSVRALTMAQVRRHFRRHYVARNMILAVAGPVDRRAVLAAARRAFRGLRPGEERRERPPPPAAAGGARLTYVTLDEPQIAFRLSFPAVPEHHPDAVALTLLRRVLDDGLSSRLPHAVVERRGLAYSIGATLELFHDAGAFEVDGACAPRNLRAALDATLATLATLRRGEIDRAELERVQHRSCVHLNFLKDSPAELCTWFGVGALFGRFERFEAKCAEARAVRLTDLVRVARTYLTSRTLAIVGVGPASGRRALTHVARSAETALGEGSTTPPRRRTRSAA